MRLANQMALVGLTLFVEANVHAEEGGKEVAALADEIDVAALEGALDEAQIAKMLEEIKASFTWQTGDVVVGDNLATLRLGEAYRFLGPSDAKRVLEDLWDNPPDDGALGMVFPIEKGPLDDDNWGVIVSYTEEGHIEDDDAASIDYAEMLTDIQEAAIAENAERVAAGYGTLTIKGWAEPPHYDAATKKLYWAKELNFDGEDESTLNYDIRVLGRKGMLILQAVSPTRLLPEVRVGMQGILEKTEFNPGSRYTDFNPDLDDVATYGIAALVAGKMASKVGILAVAGAFLAKGWKLVMIAGAALLAIIGKFKKKD